jgi:hypothetical protein
MSLSIGIVLGGPEVARSPLDALLTRLARSLRDIQASEPHEGGPELNLVFYVPGSQFSPDFSGVRISTFSRRAKTLMVQIAVSEGQVRAPALEDILSSCKAAVELAAQWLTTRISYESKHDLSILADVGNTLRH